jgi:uncharacterized damage-inducible protein DinB
MKTYDLQPNSNMTSVIGLLHSTIQYSYERLKRSVTGLTQREIDYKGQNNELNSIAQQIRHLTVVQLHWVYRFQSLPVPPELQNIFGPMYDESGKLPNVEEVNLETLLEQYEEVQEMFQQVCVNLTDEDLTKAVPFEKGNTATIRWGIWHIADHNRHHYANIAFIKKHLEVEEKF